MEQETIAALATPFGVGGIGIIRLSGPRAIEVAQVLYHSKNPGSLSGGHFPSHRMLYGQIVAPKSKKIIDEVLLVAMKAPRSYTREDVVEIHSHSGPIVLQAIIKLVLEQNVRLALPY
jgi:tRNA modification GTPase